MALSNKIPKTEYFEKHYNKIDLDHWKDHVWWENGEWKEFLPIEEHYRIPIFERYGVPEKYYMQACKNEYNKYKESHGNHFVEVLEMRELKKNGYKWLYDNYKLFNNPGPKYFEGTEIIKRIIGSSKIYMLHDIASPMPLKPTEPDLFAYKKINNGDAKYEMMFIELKRKDQVSDKQYLGINLIEKYLNIPCRIVRYKEVLEDIRLMTNAPRNIWQSAVAEQNKTSESRQARKWDESSFFEELQARKGTKVAETAKKIIAWGKNKVYLIDWGKGEISGSFTIKYNDKGGKIPLISVRISGNVTIWFYRLHNSLTIFKEEKNKLELLNLLNGIPGISLSKDVITKEPSIPLSVLNDEPSLKRFLEILDWVTQKLKNTRM